MKNNLLLSNTIIYSHHTQKRGKVILQHKLSQIGYSFHAKIRQNKQDYFTTETNAKTALVQLDCSFDSNIGWRLVEKNFQLKFFQKILHLPPLPIKPNFHGYAIITQTH